MEVRSAESPRHLGISRMRDGAGRCREAISRLINDGCARTWRDDGHVSLALLSPLPLLLLCYVAEVVRRGTKRRTDRFRTEILRSTFKIFAERRLLLFCFVLSGFLSFSGRKICDSSPLLLEDVFDRA